MELRGATVEDHPAIRSLLQDSHLPVDDLDAAAIDFIVAIDGATVTGVVGVESFGDIGLLRSLAVRVERRGQGIGERLVDALEVFATARGMRRLVLLTETAAPFFGTRGYVVTAREQAPSAVKASAEFRSLCPASATCMIKSLGTAA
jgi:amino-acid N-acetyltransferase